MDSPVVVARALTKDFKVAQKASGPLSTLRHFVRRRYRLVRAVDSVSFAIRAGERVAILGANGAGKTTLVKLMCGLLRPTGGRVELLGTEPIRREISVRRQRAWSLRDGSVPGPSSPQTTISSYCTRSTAWMPRHTPSARRGSPRCWEFPAT